MRAMAYLAIGFLWLFLANLSAAIRLNNFNDALISTIENTRASADMVPLDEADLILETLQDNIERRHRLVSLMQQIHGTKTIAESTYPSDPILDPAIFEAAFLQRARDTVREVGVSGTVNGIDGAFTESQLVKVDIAYGKSWDLQEDFPNVRIMRNGGAFDHGRLGIAQATHAELKVITFARVLGGVVSGRLKYVAVSRPPCINCVRNLAVHALSARAHIVAVYKKCDNVAWTLFGPSGSYFEYEQLENGQVELTVAELDTNESPGYYQSLVGGYTLQMRILEKSMQHKLTNSNGVGDSGIRLGGKVEGHLSKRQNLPESAFEKFVLQDCDPDFALGGKQILRGASFQVCNGDSLSLYTGLPRLVDGSHEPYTNYGEAPVEVGFAGDPCSFVWAVQDGRPDCDDGTVVLEQVFRGVGINRTRTVVFERALTDSGTEYTNIFESGLTALAGLDGDLSETETCTPPEATPSPPPTESPPPEATPSPGPTESPAPEPTPEPTPTASPMPEPTPTATAEPTPKPTELPTAEPTDDLETPEPEEPPNPPGAPPPVVPPVVPFPFPPIPGDDDDDDDIVLYALGLANIDTSCSTTCANAGATRCTETSDASIVRDYCEAAAQQLNLALEAPETCREGAPACHFNGVSQTSLVFCAQDEHQYDCSTKFSNFSQLCVCEQEN